MIVINYHIYLKGILHDIYYINTYSYIHKYCIMPLYAVMYMIHITSKTIIISDIFCDFEKNI